MNAQIPVQISSSGCVQKVLPTAADLRHKKLSPIIAPLPSTSSGWVSKIGKFS
jgi:hypothetical protein